MLEQKCTILNTDAMDFILPIACYMMPFLEMIINLKTKYMHADLKGALEQINRSYKAFEHRGQRMTKSEVKKVLAGTWKAADYWGGMKDNIVMLAPITKNAPDGAEAKVNDLKKKILDGTFNVFAGPIKDQKGTVKVPAGSALADKDQLSCDWFVEGVIGKIKNK